MPYRNSNKSIHIPIPTVQGWTAHLKTSQASSGVSCKPTSIPSYLSSLSRCRPDVSIAILQLLMNGRFPEAYPCNKPSVPLTPLLEPRASLCLFPILLLRTSLQSFSYSRQPDDSSKPIRAEILPQMTKIEDSA